MNSKTLQPQLLDPATLDAALALGESCFPRAEDRSNIREVFGLIANGTMARYSPALRLNVRMLPHFVYFSSEEAVGIGGLCEYEGDTQAAYLGWFAVKPNFQGQGIGSKIISHLAALATLYGFTGLATVTDGDESNPAMTFYRKQGFVFDRPFQFNGLECVVLRRNL